MALTIEFTHKLVRTKLRIAKESPIPIVSNEVIHIYSREKSELRLSHPFSYDCKLTSIMMKLLTCQESLVIAQPR